jgi:hypothetical protein
VTTLVTQIQDADRTLADTIHQASVGVLEPKEAAAQIQAAIDAGVDYQKAAQRLVVPSLYTSHRTRLLEALDSRDSALKLAASYLDRLGQIPDARAAKENTEADYQAALLTYQQAPTDLNAGKALTAKRHATTAGEALDRLQTRADQDLQQFDTRWREYLSGLPPVPPP